ncbi:retrovirus-related pol polyprotein from transposon TNT 1-94 [Tanacetum coccineum]
MPNPEDITDPTTTMNMELILMAKAFKLNYSTPTNNNQRISSDPRNRQVAQPGINIGQDRKMQMVGGNDGDKFGQYAGQIEGNQNGYNAVQNVGNQNPNGNGNVVVARAEGNAIGNNDNQIRCYICRGLGHLARNCIQASTSGTQIDKAPVYDSDGSAEVHKYDNCYNNEIFNMITQEEQYTDLLEPIPEPHQVQQNDNNVISAVSSVEQSGGIIEQNPATVEETRALYDSLYNNLAIKVEKVNTVNRKLKETNAELTTELARYKNQEKCFEINQEKYDKLKRLQNFEIQFLKEAAKFVRDFKSLAKEAAESLANHKALEFEIERLLRVVVGQDIMSIVQSNSVVDTSNLQTELDRTKEKLEICIIKKEKEYVILWNNWYTKCEECKYDKISYDKAYNDMQQRIERLQA